MGAQEKLINDLVDKFGGRQPEICLYILLHRKFYMSGLYPLCIPFFPIITIFVCRGVLNGICEHASTEFSLRARALTKVSLASD